MQNGLQAATIASQRHRAHRTADRTLPRNCARPRRCLRQSESHLLESCGSGVASHRRAIVLRTGFRCWRRQDQARLESDAASEVWRTRLALAADHVRRAAQAVGRVDVMGHTQLQWVGTAWIVAPGTVVTNRHVAREFSRLSGNRFIFRRAADGAAMAASVDFLREMDPTTVRPARCRSALHRIRDCRRACGD